MTYFKSYLPRKSTQIPYANSPMFFFLVSFATHISLCSYLLSYFAVDGILLVDSSSSNGLFFSIVLLFFNWCILNFRIEPDACHLIVIRMQRHKRRGKKGRKRSEGRKAVSKRIREGGMERDRCIIMPAQHSFTHSAILLVVVSIEITLSYS